MFQKISSDSLKKWFLTHKRDLPWRRGATPYQVWVSEIMLQQTRVSVVVAYFERWIKAFPTIEALANAPQEQVIKLWEGLGYYSRARNLHQAAKECMQQYAGELPTDPEALGKLKGIGPYTKGAILNFAFRTRAPVIDGNVLRVIARLFLIETSIDLPATRRKVEQILEEFLPHDECWLVSEALMELGALVCTPKPVCNLCPLQSSCGARAQKKESKLPIRAARAKITPLFRLVALVEHKGKVLLQKAEQGGLMADLYEFPYIEIDHMLPDSSSALSLFEQKLGLKLAYKKSLPEQTHSFTRYRAKLFPYFFETKTSDPQLDWYPVTKLNELSFSSGHKRILEATF